MRTFDIGELVGRFPEFRVAVVVSEAQAVPIFDPEAHAALLDQCEAECLARWGGTELSQIPGIAAWRTAYKAFGIKKTSYRSSVERLVKRVQAGLGLPRIHPIVDIYNAVSLRYVLCLGADDLDKVTGDLSFRYARAGDSFTDMAAEPGEDPNDPPKPGEIVYADAAHVLCRRWNWRQDGRSLVSPATRRAIITVQSNGWGDVEAAASELGSLLMRHCGLQSRILVADADRPRLEI